MDVDSAFVSRQSCACIPSPATSKPRVEREKWYTCSWIKRVESAFCKICSELNQGVIKTSLSCCGLTKSHVGWISHPVVSLPSRGASDTFSTSPGAIRRREYWANLWPYFKVKEVPDLSILPCQPRSQTCTTTARWRRRPPNHAISVTN